MTIEANRIYQGDCLEVMRDIPDASVDMILCDLPYGVTQNPWDSIIPLDALWMEYHRVAKKNAAIVLSAIQPFASTLVMSNPSEFKYEWIWEKTKKTGFLNAQIQPLRSHEQVLVFYGQQPVYNPQGVHRCNKRCDRGTEDGTGTNYGKATPVYRQQITGYPTSIIKVGSEMNISHPTQKPVKLFEYLIKTYTNEGDTVLDNCIGSGTTAIACRNTGRNFIGIELNPEYFAIANKRLLSDYKTLDNFGEVLA